MQFSVEICVAPGICASLSQSGSGNIVANFVKFNVEILVQAGSPKIALLVLVSLSVHYIGCKMGYYPYRWLPKVFFNS